MKWTKAKFLAVTALMIAALAVALVVSTPAPTYAAYPVGGAFTATAGSGGVTAGTFVTLSAEKTIVTATAVTDSVIGVAETTVSADGMTSYAPPGTIVNVTSGEAIAVNDKLTAGAGGKAFVLDADDASTQHVGGIALEAASGADESIKIFVTTSVVEQRLALAGSVSITAANTFTTGTGAVTLAGDVTMANGATLVNGDTDTLTITEQDVVVAGALTTQTSLVVPGYKAGSVAVAGDDLIIPVTNGVVLKTTGGDGEALSLADGTKAQLLVITLVTDGNGDGTLTPTTATGWATIVFADVGDTAVLLYIDSLGWVIIGLHGTAAPPAFTT